MKNLIFLFLLGLGTINLSAQNDTSTVKEGDLFQIASPSSQEYKHINFPKGNFIIKRGGIASHKLVIGKKVVVTQVTEREDGVTEVRVKPANHSRFYNALSSVTLDYEKALSSNEITLL
ncbi:hypothetical protein ACFO5T_05785 [Dokdonia genika]|uniref:Dihydroorotase n=1 Tax=Dokdonia genika TaxID=308113 RepID=A0ABV9L744_9FLAO